MQSFSQFGNVFAPLFDRQFFFITVVVQNPVHAGVVVVAERASIVPLNELLCDSFVQVCALFKHFFNGKTSS